MSIKAFNFIVIWMIAATASKAWAWADLGHQVVGEIAERNLSPRGKNFVRSILGIEPLALAATWPDHVRDDGRFGSKDPAHDFSPFHFCEAPTGYDYVTKPRKEPRDCMGVLKKTAQLLKDSSVAREAKMIALRYFVHVVGDVHQPLHVGNGYDRGGNACTVKVKRTSEPGITQDNFHHYWDGILVDELGVQILKTSRRKGPIYYSRFVDAIQSRHPEIGPAAVTAQARLTPLDWLKEGQALRENIYPDNAKTLKKGAPGEEFKRRTYCQWYQDQRGKPENTIESNKLPLLNESYAKKFIPVAEGQMIKAGLRLASALNQMAQEASETSGLNDTEQENILQSVMDGFTITE